MLSNTSICTRLKEVVDLKTGGNQSEFASEMGWTPQYLSRLVKGAGGVGIRPVMSILEHFPDINARWLLLGEGMMLSSEADALKEHLLRLLLLEKYLPVMSEEEIEHITHEERIGFPEEKIAEWAVKLAARQKLVTDAMRRSDRGGKTSTLSPKISSKPSKV